MTTNDLDTFCFIHPFANSTCFEDGVLNNTDAILKKASLEGKTEGK